MTFDRITAVSNTLESRLHNAKTNFKKGIFVICQCKDEKCEIDISHTEPIKSTLQTLCEYKTVGLQYWFSKRKDHELSYQRSYLSQKRDINSCDLDMSVEFENF